MPHYDVIRDQLKSGDLVLFSGRSGFSSSIKWFTNSRWSHIGMVLRHKDFDSPLIWESLRLGQLPDVLLGEVRDGVQTLSMDERIEQCSDAVSVRLLNQPLTDDMVCSLWALHEELQGRPYEQRLWELVRAVYDGPLGDNEEDLTSLFCSELVAVAYQRMNLLPCVSSGGAPSNEYTPAYFCVRGAMELELGWKLGQPITVNLQR